MKIVAYVLAFAAWSAAANVHAFQARVHKPLTAAIQFIGTLEKSSFPSNVPIELKVSLINRTKRPIYLTESNSLVDYHIEVRNEQGGLAPLTPEGKQMFLQSMWIGRRLTIELQPGQQKEERFQLNKIWEMRHGSYSIIVKRKIALELGKRIVDVTSNRLMVRID